MVQFFGESKNKGNYLSEILGPSLGAGLSEFTNSYYANKALDDILNDSSLKDSPVQDRLSKIERAVSPYGKIGEKLFKRRVDLEQEGIREREASAKEQSVRGKLEKQKIEDTENYETIKRNYGQDAADIYKAAPTGGKTEILRQIFESKKRGIDLKEAIGNIESAERETKEAEKISPKIDFDKGLTPKEKVARQDKRYSINLPLAEEDSARKRSYEKDKLATDKLRALSQDIGFAQRLNINPTTGDLFFPGLASPEAQEFSKILNDFTRNAKESYGARVTNFDLQQFMKRLPTLANSQEGRERIFDYMNVINDINLKYQNELDSVLAEYGGIRHIDYDVARRMAEDRSKDKILDLKNEFSKIDREMNSDFNKEIEQYKKMAPKDYIPVQDSSGKMSYLPKSNLSKALERGYKPL